MRPNRDGKKPKKKKKTGKTGEKKYRVYNAVNDIRLYCTRHGIPTKMGKTNENFLNSRRRGERTETKRRQSDQGRTIFLRGSTISGNAQPRARDGKRTVDASFT